MWDNTRRGTTARHTCEVTDTGAPLWGKKTPGCPRCDELLSGSKPRRWGDTRAVVDSAPKAVEPKAEPKFVDTKQAFSQAIAEGRLSENPSASNYYGNYMYMYTMETPRDYFKNKDTRRYDV